MFRARYFKQRASDLAFTREHSAARLLLRTNTPTLSIVCAWGTPVGGTLRTTVLRMIRTPRQ